VSFCKGSCEIVLDLLFKFFAWFDNTEEEFGWDAKSKDTINVSSHDFQMNKSLEEFLEIVLACVHHLDLSSVEIQFKFSLKSLVFHILLNIIVESLSLESIFLKKSYVIKSLVLESCNSIQLIVFLVELMEGICTSWNNTWHNNGSFMFMESSLDFSINNFFCCISIFSI